MLNVYVVHFLSTPVVSICQRTLQILFTAVPTLIFNGKNGISIKRTSIQYCHLMCFQIVLLTKRQKIYLQDISVDKETAENINSRKL